MENKLALKETRIWLICIMAVILFNLLSKGFIAGILLGGSYYLTVSFVGVNLLVATQKISRLRANTKFENLSRQLHLLFPLSSALLALCLIKQNHTSVFYIAISLALLISLNALALLLLRKIFTKILSITYIILSLFSLTFSLQLNNLYPLQIPNISFTILLFAGIFSAAVFYALSNFRILNRYPQAEIQQTEISE